MFEKQNISFVFFAWTDDDTQLSENKQLFFWCALLQTFSGKPRTWTENLSEGKLFAARTWFAPQMSDTGEDRLYNYYYLPISFSTSPSPSLYYSYYLSLYLSLPNILLLFYYLS